MSSQAECKYAKPNASLHLSLAMDMGALAWLFYIIPPHAPPSLYAPIQAVSYMLVIITVLLAVALTISGVSIIVRARHCMPPGMGYGAWGITKTTLTTATVLGVTTWAWLTHYIGFFAYEVALCIVVSIHSVVMTIIYTDNVIKPLIKNTKP